MKTVFSIYLSLLLITTANSQCYPDSLEVILLEINKDESDTNLYDSIYNAYDPKDYIRVKLIFHGNCEQFYFDHNAIIPSEFNNEDFELDNVKNIDSVHEKLKRSQIIVENYDNEFKFLSSINRRAGLLFYPDEDYTVIYEDSYELFDFKNGNAQVTSNKILLDNLKVNPNDNKVRLHYLFVPNPNYTDNTLKYRLSTDWIQLPSTCREAK